MRILLAALAALLAGAAQAQPRLYNQAELDALLAPIALQPDAVVSHVLVAANYPDDVAEAAQWSRANPHLRGDDAARAVEPEPWHPSVKALVAFPELLERMYESPQWLHELGEAFRFQEPHVMATVQALRRRARAAGHLASTEYQAVYDYGEAIVVQPRTEVVYVRYYDPYVVYGPWWWPHYRPVFWRPWIPRPVVVKHIHVVEKHVVVRPYVRVPESQRRPIVSHQGLHKPMPAASGFSQPHPRFREFHERPRFREQPQFRQHPGRGNALRKHRG